MSVKPIRDYIVVRKDEEKESVSSGGIIQVTVSSSSRNATGVVLAVGSGRLSMDGKTVALEVKEGDRVVFEPRGAIEVQDGGKTVHLLREDQVICVLG